MLRDDSSAANGALAARANGESGFLRAVGAVEGGDGGKPPWDPQHRPPSLQGPTTTLFSLFRIDMSSCQSMSCHLVVPRPHKIHHGTQARWKPGYRDGASSHRTHCRLMACQGGWRPITVVQAQRHSSRLSLAHGMPCALSLGSSLDATADAIQQVPSSRLMASSSGYASRFEFLFGSVQQTRHHAHVLCPDSVRRCTDVHQRMSIICTLARCEVSTLSGPDMAWDPTSNRAGHLRPDYTHPEVCCA
jgi:hypothetical protein